MPYNSLKMTHTDGTMHHLGVNESHIAKQVVLIPNPQEAKALAALLDDAECKGDYREYVTYTGSYKGKPATIMSCGFGCMPMAIAVEELWHLGAEKIIKIDACAAISSDIKLGEMKCAKGAIRGDGVTKEYIDLAYPAFPDIELMMKLNKCCEGGEPGYFRSHDCLHNESPYVYGGRSRMEKWSALGVEVMDAETSALFVIGTIHKLKVASAAVISENYATGECMSECDRDEAVKKLCLAALDAIID